MRPHCSFCVSKEFLFLFILFVCRCALLYYHEVLLLCVHGWFGIRVRVRVAAHFHSVDLLLLLLRVYIYLLAFSCWLSLPALSLRSNFFSAFLLFCFFLCKWGIMMQIYTSLHTYYHHLQLSLCRQRYVNGGFRWGTKSSTIFFLFFHIMNYTYCSQLFLFLFVSAIFCLSL